MKFCYKKSVLLVICSIFFVSSLFAQDADTIKSEIYPKIILRSDYFNFGKVSKREGKISKVFKLSNKGKTNLVITNIKASCTCTMVSLSIGKYKSPYFDAKGAPSDWRAELKPKEAAELEVILDLGHPSIHNGNLIREVSVMSNDPLYPEVKIKVEAQVSE